MTRFMFFLKERYVQESLLDYLDAINKDYSILDTESREAYFIKRLSPLSAQKLIFCDDSRVKQKIESVFGKSCEQFIIEDLSRWALYRNDKLWSKLHYNDFHQVLKNLPENGRMTFLKNIGTELDLQLQDAPLRIADVTCFLRPDEQQQVAERVRKLSARL